MVNVLLAAIIKLLPKDLVAGLELVGEGGSVTVTGHPIAWIFVVASTAIDEVLVVLSAGQQTVKLYR